MDEMDSGPGDSPFGETDAAESGFEADDDLDDVSHTGSFKSGAGNVPLDDAEKLLECPSCEEVLDSATGDGPADIDEGDIRVPINCPNCYAELTLFVESALPDALDDNFSVEQHG